MAGSLNRVMLIGNLGADPEIRQTNAGDPIANFSLATSERWTDKTTGEKRERTEWHRVVIFNENLAKLAENYLRKGSKIYIEGQLQTRKWTDQSGQDRYTTEVALQRYRGEVTMLDSAGANRPPPAQDQDDYGRIKDGEAGRAAAADSGAGAPPIDDEIPF